ncbi:hypothetical protein DV735_g4519, partial [Chaetothyriales sp. CBS 134920]
MDSLRSAEIDDAFSQAPDLQQRVRTAIKEHPHLAPLFVDIARFHLQSSEDHEASPTKKRKLDNGAAQAQAQNGTNGDGDAALPSGPPTVLLDIADVSWSMPQRKKLHVRITVDGDAGSAVKTFSLQAIDPKTSRVELVASLGNYARVLCLPVPEKTQRLFNYCFIPKPNAAAEAIVFALPGPPLKSATVATEWPSHIPRPGGENPLEEILATISSKQGLGLDKPDPDLFVSVFPDVQRKNENAYHVKAHVGTKDGYLFFLSTGIFFGFKKPIKFIPLDSIDSTSFVRPVSRTFGLAITYSEEGKDSEEIEFDQIDNTEHGGINEYIQKHGIQDGSFSESRKAKLLSKDKAGQPSRNGADGEEADDDGRTELEKAEQQLQDEEDEMEEDYDPDEADSDSGSESDSGDEEYVGGKKKDLVAEELGSEAEAESYFTYTGQEESPVNHDVHFRAGQTPKGEDTYTPRTVIYDLKGGFGTLRKINALYEVEVDQRQPLGALWDGTTSTQQEAPIEPSRYQVNLELGLPTFQLHDSDVRYWSDFNRVYLHPRSIVQLNQYELNSQIMPFENWAAGEELFRQTDRESDLLDRDVRLFAEECDHMQGFQIFTTTDDAWGGYSAKYVEALRDEYAKTSIWTWGIQDTTPARREVEQRRAANTARSLRSFAQQASAYIRLATQPGKLPSYVNLTGTSDWRTTALLCSGLETLTLPTRLHSEHSRYAPLSFFQDTLNVNGGQNLFELSMSVNCQGSQTETGKQWRSQQHAATNGGNANGWEQAILDLSLQPGKGCASESTHTFGQIEVCRWREQSLFPNRPENAEEEKHHGHQQIRQQHDDGQGARRKNYDQFTTNLLFPNLDTFAADLFSTSTPAEAGLEITAALSTGSRMKTNLLAVRDVSTRLVGLDEREALYSDLTNLAYSYSFGWESDSDSEEDD